MTRDKLATWLRPSRGRGVRDIVMLLSFIQAGVRILDGAGMQPVNILPSPVYGWLMLAVGLALAWTGRDCRRGSYAGRLAALAAGGLWLLLATDIWGAGASFGNALLIALAAGNEAHYRDC
jgi:hypothetical protein